MVILCWFIIPTCDVAGWLRSQDTATTTVTPKEASTHLAFINSLKWPDVYIIPHICPVKEMRRISDLSGSSFSKKKKKKILALLLEFRDSDIKEHMDLILPLKQQVLAFASPQFQRNHRWTSPPTLQHFLPAAARAGVCNESCTQDVFLGHLCWSPDKGEGLILRHKKSTQECMYKSSLRVLVISCGFFS